MRQRLTRLAQSLRPRQTPAESLLWYKLRDRQMDGLKFKRQVQRGPYIVDLLCVEAMLILEIDGSHHLTRDQADAERTRYLESLGYLVLRFWNVEVTDNTTGVLEAIYATANQRRKAPSSALRAPSPQGEKDSEK